MVKLLSASLYRYTGVDTSPLLLCSTSDLTSFGYFSRGTIAEHLRFAGRTVVGRTKPGSRQTVGLKDNPFVVHSYVRHDNLAGCIISDEDYPQRVAFTLLNKFMMDYESEAKSNGIDWTNQTADNSNSESERMATDLATYQNPTEADKLSKISKELDEIKDIMHHNIDEVLKRGETLDSLMERSQDLSATSVTFYKRAKQQNQCCKMY
jgi:synaptobrevin family protein YKT6